MDRVTRLSDSIRDPQTYAIIGAAMEVHRVLGPGFLEGVYRNALKVELTSRGIQHACEVEFPVYYKGMKLDGRFRADFVCNNAIITEIKAMSAFGKGRGTATGKLSQGGEGSTWLAGQFRNQSAAVQKVCSFQAFVMGEIHTAKRR